MCRCCFSVYVEWFDAVEEVPLSFLGLFDVRFYTQFDQPLVAFLSLRRVTIV
jgi:hypothetical protein